MGFEENAKHVQSTTAAVGDFVSKVGPDFSIFAIAGVGAFTAISFGGDAFWTTMVAAVLVIGWLAHRRQRLYEERVKIDLDLKRLQVNDGLRLLQRFGSKDTDQQTMDLPLPAERQEGTAP